MIHARQSSDFTLAFFILMFVSIHGFLLKYSYTFQPCIGSGLIPNNKKDDRSANCRFRRKLPPKATMRFAVIKTNIGWHFKVMR